MKYITIALLVAGIAGTQVYAENKNIIQYRGQELTEVQRRAFFFRDPKNDTEFYQNVEQVHFIEDKGSDITGLSIANDIWLKDKFGEGVQAVHDEKILVNSVEAMRLVNGCDSLGNTALHKFVYFIDVDKDLYDQLSPEQKKKINTEQLIKRFEHFRGLGADFKKKNGEGKTPLEMFRFSDSVGARALQTVLENLPKWEKERKEKYEKMMKDRDKNAHW